MRIRTARRPQPIAGTGKQIIKSAAPGGIRQMRCGSCHGMMAPALHHDGKEIMKCLQCGSMATSRPM